MTHRLRTTDLDGLSEVAIMELNLPTSISIVHELTKYLNVINPMQFFGDKELIHKAMAKSRTKGDQIDSYPKNTSSTGSYRLHPSQHLFH